MLWEWLLQQIVESMEWLGGLIAGMIPPVPAWVESLPGYIHTVAGWMATVSHWFPVEWLVVVILAVVGTWIAGLAVKVIRIVASFLTVGGGSAG